MAEQNKKQNENQELDLEKMEDVAGGWAWDTKFSTQDATKYGVGSDYKVFGKSKYYVDGKETSEDLAKAAYKARKNFGK